MLFRSVEEKDGEPLLLPGDAAPVDPEDVDLSRMEEYLAQQVADGELTQEEADQMLAEVQEMLEQAEDGDVTMWISVDSSGNANSFCVSSFGGVEAPSST